MSKRSNLAIIISVFLAFGCAGPKEKPDGSLLFKKVAEEKIEKTQEKLKRNVELGVEVAEKPLEKIETLNQYLQSSATEGINTSTVEDLASKFSDDEQLLDSHLETLQSGDSRKILELFYFISFTIAENINDEFDNELFANTKATVLQFPLAKKTKAGEDFMLVLIPYFQFEKNSILLPEYMTLTEGDVILEESGGAALYKYPTNSNFAGQQKTMKYETIVRMANKDGEMVERVVKGEYIVEK